MAFLRNDNVVFYHPLDDRVEFTQSDTWVGSGTFSAAKIDNGYLAVGIDDPSFGLDSFVLESGGSLTGMALYSHGMVKLDDSSFVMVYRTDESGSVTKDRIVVGQISGTTISYGSGVQIDTGEGATDSNTFRVAHLGSGECILIKTSGSNVQAMHFTVSGTDIAIGEGVDIGAGFSPDIVALSGNKALVSRSVFAGASPDRDGKLKVLSLSGSTLSAGSDVTFAGANNTGPPWSIMSVMPSDEVILAWTEDDLDVIRASLVTVSGTTPTISTQVTVASGSISNNSSLKHYITPVSGDRFVIAYTSSSGFGARGPYFIVGEVSGSTLNFGSPVKWPSTEIGGIPAISMDKLTDSRIIVHRGSRDPTGESSVTNAIRVVNISGLSIESFEVNIDPNITENNWGGEVIVYGNDIVIGGSDKLSDIETNFGSLTTEDQIESVTGVYPSVSGYDRVSVAFWTIIPTLSNSTMDIERGYRVELGPSSIAFVNGSPSSGVATWTGSGIDALMSGLNDGFDHFVVLDFEHQSSGNWNLSTSTDGSGFVDRSIHGSGSQDVISADTQPVIKVGLCEGGRWVDEAILWAGDKSTFTQFSGSELTKLYELAEINNRTMNQYTFETDTIDLFIGSIDNINDNATLFVAGPLPITDNATLYIAGSGDAPSSAVDILFTEFIKTPDFTPQIIGSFTDSILSATIMVWDVTVDPPVLITLIDDNCVEIGSTDRWRWSTINLPVNLRNIGHYQYLMTANNSEMFEGQFILKQNNSANFIIPNNQSEFIL